jgi:hypothetical protein
VEHAKQIRRQNKLPGNKQSRKDSSNKSATPKRAARNRKPKAWQIPEFTKTTKTES